MTYVDESITSVLVNAVHVDDVPLLTRKRAVEIEACKGRVAVSPERRGCCRSDRASRQRWQHRPGFVSGLHLNYGAVAATVAHDSHNLVVVDMIRQTC